MPHLLVTSPKQEQIMQKLYEEVSRYYPWRAGYWKPRELLSNCKYKHFRRAGDISLTHFLPVVDDLEAHPELQVNA